MHTGNKFESIAVRQYKRGNPESILAWSAVLLAALLTGCSQWPPHQSEFTDQFIVNRKEIESLRNMFERTKYEHVRLNFAGTLRGYWVEEGSYTEQDERIEDSTRWIELFNAAGLDGITLLENGDVMIPVESYVRQPEYESFVSFVQSTDILDRVRLCEDTRTSNACGRCIVNLDTDWWLEYVWWPVDLADADFDAWQNGELSDDDYYDLSSRKMDQCFAEGGTLR